MMRIGELSRRSGLPASRIRFYEAIGLLNTVERSASGYRLYPPEALLMLDIIIFAQQAGFALDDIRPLLPEPASTAWRREDLLNTLERKVVEIDRLRRKLADTRRQLVAVIASIREKPDDIACIDNVSPTLKRAR